MWAHFKSDILLDSVSEATARRFYRKCGYRVEQVADEEALGDADALAVVAAVRHFNQLMATAAHATASIL